MTFECIGEGIAENVIFFGRGLVTADTEPGRGIEPDRPDPAPFRAFYSRSSRCTMLEGTRTAVDGRSSARARALPRVAW